MGRIRTAVLFLFIFSSCGILFAQESPWVLKQSRDGIPVYTRKVAGSPILEYKANVIINEPSPKVIAFFEDEKQIPRWYYQCVHAELVERSSHQVVLYLVLRLPWPVTARDVVFSRDKLEDPVNGTITYSLTALPDRLPRAKGMIRVPTIKSSWIFKSLSSGHTQVFFQQHSDPGGSIPAFMVNELAVDTPYNSLKNFRKMVAGKEE